MNQTLQIQGTPPRTIPTQPPTVPSAPVSPATSLPIVLPKASRDNGAGQVDLFSPIALNSAAGTTTDVPSAAMRDPGGHTVSGRDPNAPRSNSELREEAANNIREMLGEDKMKADLAAGRVAPRWRDAERAIQEDFHPPPADVSDDSFGRTLFKAVAKYRPTGGDTPRGVDPSVSNNPYGGGLNGTMATPTGGGAEPNAADIRRCVIEVVIAADGHVVSSRFISQTHRHRFDDAALAAVLKAVAKGGKLDEGTDVVTKWSAESWVALNASIAPGLTFDESLGKARGNYPGRKSTPTKIALLSVLPRE